MQFRTGETLYAAKWSMRNNYLAVSNIVRIFPPKLAARGTNEKAVKTQI